MVALLNNLILTNILHHAQVTHVGNIYVDYTDIYVQMKRAFLDIYVQMKRAVM